MKTQITTILIVCGALLASATSASALSGVSGGWHCWFTVSEKTCYWPHGGEPYYNLDGTRNVKADTVINETEVAEIDTGTVIGETEVAMLRPRSEIKYWACMNGATGYTMQNKNSPCKYTPRPVYGRIGSISPGNHIGTDNTVVAMMSPKEYMYTTCIPHGQSGSYRGTRLSSHSSSCNGYKARTYRSLSSTEPQDTDPTQVVMWGNHGGNIFDGNSWRNFWNKENWHVDTPELPDGETQIALMRPEFVDYDPYTDTFNPTYSGKLDESDLNIFGEFETQLAHHNACGQFNCKTDEVEAPIYNDVLASTEFGNCLLNDAPIDIETLVDCRADACLGRKGYYGAVETVQ